MDTNKIEVFNPLHLHNTVGEELLDILNENNYSKSILKSLKIDIDNPKGVTKISKSNVNRIAQIINNEYMNTYLLKFQDDYKRIKLNSEEDFKELKKIYNKIKHLEPFVGDKPSTGMDKLEDLSIFLDIENEKDIFKVVKKNIALYKISSFVPDDLNLYAWLKKGEKDFKAISLPEYNKLGLIAWISSMEWKNNIQNFDYFVSIPQILAKFGVGVVLTPYLKKTVYGCVRWFDDKPLVQISDKGKSLASLWYVLFHELGHVIKHENDEIFEGEDISKTKVTKKEKEANEFANKYLFNGDSLRKYIFTHKGKFFDDAFITNTSEKFNSDEFFVAFWAKKAAIKGIRYYKYDTQVSF